MNLQQFPLVAFALLLTACAPKLPTSPSPVAAAIQPANTLKIEENDSHARIIEKAAHVVPTPNQLAALRNEYIAFVHFGPNTFTRMEWGSGEEDPKIFDLKNLDTDQWCEAMKASGMTMVILTVKHHDGFVLWQSRYTDHGVMSTNFQNGKGDILRDLSASCKKYGLKLGIYLSPADLYQIENKEGLYGNLSPYTLRTIPRAVPGRPFANKTTFEFEVDDYNEYFLNQLFELLTEYGEVHEVWFDGAHPKTKGGQQYNYPAWKTLIRRLAPNAVIFGKEDIRWGGNESGATRDTEWNVIPYAGNPDTARAFVDLTDEDLGSREMLYRAKYLHYQPAETNTSIREGWFYRDDQFQKVRSADDVFDIYERSVGGNSIFLLNIPPNRDGKFSQQDVDVLHEVGDRIQETYGTNLLQGAVGNTEALDGNPQTFSLMPGSNPEMVLTLPAMITLNRLVLQEAIATHSERVERHAVDAWLDNGWKEIATATNIGYKRILRFPEVTTNRLRLRVLESRLTPAISNITAHYYAPRPPQLAFTRSLDGKVTIAPKMAEFNWKPHGENAAANLNTGYTIYYTLDGSEPGAQSQKYDGPINPGRATLRAVAIQKNETGPVESYRFGLLKNTWRLMQASSAQNRHEATMAFDENPRTWWQSKAGAGEHSIAIDLGSQQTLNAMVYTPQTSNAEGMMAKGRLEVSDDGRQWKTVEQFEFGNLINDPTARTHRFKSPVSARFVRVMATEISANGDRVSIAELDFL